MTDKVDLKLGLIGDNIAQSKAPLLHRLAGQQNGLTVTYARLVPKEMGADFEEILTQCAATGYHGVNVTYPYKERAAKQVTVTDPLVRAIGAINTVLFGPDGPKGYNTDYSGFIAAYRAQMADAAPGIACLIGAGGVGRALAFGLIALGASEIRLYDTVEAKAQALANDLWSVGKGTKVTVYNDASAAAHGATGLLNGTPVGMAGYGGIPLLPEAIRDQAWAFDAVYTPEKTNFLCAAVSAGLSVISGYELFFYQGVNAWAHFANRPLDETRLRLDLVAKA